MFAGCAGGRRDCTLVQLTCSPARAVRLPPNRDDCRSSAAVPASRKSSAEIDGASTGCPTATHEFEGRRSRSRIVHRDDVERSCHRPRRTRRISLEPIDKTGRCAISWGIFPSSRWNLLRTQAACECGEVALCIEREGGPHGIASPKNHAKPGPLGSCRRAIPRDHACPRTGC